MPITRCWVAGERDTDAQLIDALTQLHLKTHNASCFRFLSNLAHLLYIYIYIIPQYRYQTAKAWQVLDKEFKTDVMK